MVKKQPRARHRPPQQRPPTPSTIQTLHIAQRLDNPKTLKHTIRIDNSCSEFNS